MGGKHREDEETFSCDGDVHYLDGGDGFMGVDVCQYL